MRHGQAEHNVQRFYNSRCSSPPSHLTLEGKAQALRTAEELLKQGYNRETITTVYVSPLARTQETAMILVKAGVISEEQIIIDERLIEIQFDDLEGLSLAVHSWKEIFNSLHNTETQEQIYQRISAFAKEHLSSTADENILIVTHAYPAGELIKYFDFDHNGKIHMGQAIIFSSNLRY